MCIENMFVEKHQSKKQEEKNLLQFFIIKIFEQKIKIKAK